MKRPVLMALGLWLALLGAGAWADDGGDPAAPPGDADGTGTGQQADARADETSGSSGTDRKPASTATAAGAIHEAVKGGDIKIEGGTDPGAPGL
jgi:hypothetical protein